MRILILFCFLLIGNSLWGQVRGIVLGPEGPLAGANVWQVSSSSGTTTNEKGAFTLTVSENTDETLVFSYVGFTPKTFSLEGIDTSKPLEIQLIPDGTLEEIVVTSGLIPIKRLESTIPVEVYGASFLNKTLPQVCSRVCKISMGFVHRSTVVFVIRAIFKSMASKGRILLCLSTGCPL